MAIPSPFKRRNRGRYQRFTEGLANRRLGRYRYTKTSVEFNNHGTLPLQKQKLGTKTGAHGGKQTHRTGLRTAVLHYVFEHNQH